MSGACSHRPANRVASVGARHVSPRPVTVAAAEQELFGTIRTRVAALEFHVTHVNVSESVRACIAGVTRALNVAGTYATYIESQLDLSAVHSATAPVENCLKAHRILLVPSAIVFVDGRTSVPTAFDVSSVPVGVPGRRRTVTVCVQGTSDLPAELVPQIENTNVAESQGIALNVITIGLPAKA